MTIPRLELMAAMVGARLCTSVIEGLQRKDIEQHYWTDSTAVLGWIQRKESWTVFVNNRVNEINSLTDPLAWKHLPGIQNPAVLPSRGCSSRQLLSSKWWEGPTWLLEPSINWPVTEKHFDEYSINEEKRKTKSAGHSSICSLSHSNTCSCKIDEKENNGCRHYGSSWLYYYFSRYDKVIRLIAWMRRFIFNCLNAKSSRTTGELSYEEVKNAEKKVMLLIQNEYFSDHLNRRKLKSLTTYRDGDGIIRLKTKITFRKDTEDFRHPVVLPGEHQAVKRLIMTEHQKNSHAGSQMLLGILREHYWILNATKVLRSLLSKCVI